MSFELRKLSGNKKGQLGGFLGMFVATIAVVIILLVFVLISGVVRIISGVSEGVAVRGLDHGIGVEDIKNSYMGKFTSLVEVRFHLGQGKDLDSAIKEVGYEK